VGSNLIEVGSAFNFETFPLSYNTTWDENFPKLFKNLQDVYKDLLKV